VAAMAERVGDLPLPPYIVAAREAGRDYSAFDDERYRTVFADKSRRVAAAAPTAGLHFSPEVLAELDRRGHAAYDLTLAVGLGTFKPIEAEQVEDHPIHTEHWTMPGKTAAALLDRAAGPRLCVGTTALRTAEDFCRKHAAGTIFPDTHGDYAADASLYVYPPQTLAGADLLITNFHLPRSTLMCLVSAFLAPGSTAGIARLKELYELAVRENYRFYSYGDAMLIR
jgi:S-adenosylmethionine:tRNA ribosyltransferase-isomerase